jgi:hypothetical protein
MKSLFLIFLLLTLLAGCRQKTSSQLTTQSGDLVLEEYYSNGQLKSSKLFYNEAQSDYLYTAYYENGDLMDSVTFYNNVPEGKRIFFEQATGLKHIEYYENGLLEGINMGIYENGVKNYEGFRKAGQKAGEWIFRNPEGVSLTYEFFDSTGRLVYFRKYDERGNYQKSNGAVLIHAYLTENHIQPDDSVHAVITAAVPPGCESKLTILMDGDQTDEETIISEILKAPRNGFEFHVGEPGDYKVLFHLVVTDMSSGKAEESKVEKKITVKEN